MILSRMRIALLSVLLFGLLVACGAEPEEPENAPEPTAVAVEQNEEPTVVPTDVPPTATMAPTAEPTTEPTSEPTDMPTTEPTEEPTLEPTAVVEPEEDEEDDETQATATSQEGSASPPARFQTFTMEMLTEEEVPFETMEMVISIAMTPTNDADFEAIAFTMQAAMTTEPAAVSLDMSIQAASPGAGASDLESISAAQIDGTMYMSLGEMGCLPFPGEELDFADLTNVADTPSPEALAIEDEVVLVEEGVLIRNFVTDHYQVIVTDFEYEGNYYERLQMDYYQVQGDELVVRMVMDAEGVVQFDSEAADSDEPVLNNVDMTMTLDIISVDKPLEITLPEGCEEVELTLFPMMPDAEEVISFAGIQGYVTQGNPELIARFYREEMTLLGWSEVESETEIDVEAGSLFLVFENEDGTMVEIMAEPNPDGEGYQVLIFGGR